MHSSRMCTARLWPVSPGMHCSHTWSHGAVPGTGGVYLVRGVYLVPGEAPGPGGFVPGLGGVPGPGGCTWSQGGVPAQVFPPVNRMTDACENITLPQLRCRQ